MTLTISDIVSTGNSVISDFKSIQTREPILGFYKIQKKFSKFTHEILLFYSQNLYQSQFSKETKHTCIVATTLTNFCCSVAQSCPTLCHTVDWSTPGFPVLQHLPELAQTHHSIQPSLWSVCHIHTRLQKEKKKHSLDSMNLCRESNVSAF